MMIGKYLNKKRIIVSFPMPLCVLGAKILKVVTKRRMDLVEKVLRMGEDRVYSHKDATGDFGYKPEPFEIGLKREVNEYVKWNKEK